MNTFALMLHPLDISDFHSKFKLWVNYRLVCWRGYLNMHRLLELSLEQVEHISALARKHGFRLAGWHSLEKAISLNEIARIKERAQPKLKLPVQDSVSSIGLYKP